MQGGLAFGPRSIVQRSLKRPDTFFHGIMIPPRGHLLVAWVGLAATLPCIAQGEELAREQIGRRIAAPPSPAVAHYFYCVAMKRVLLPERLATTRSGGECIRQPKRSKLPRAPPLRVVRTRTAPIFPYIDVLCNRRLAGRGGHMRMAAEPGWWVARESRCFAPN